jgi:hypothetical protein
MIRGSEAKSYEDGYCLEELITAAALGAVPFKVNPSEPCLSPKNFVSQII